MRLRTRTEGAFCLLEGRTLCLERGGILTVSYTLYTGPAGCYLECRHDLAGGPSAYLLRLWGPRGTLEAEELERRGGR